MCIFTQTTTLRFFAIISPSRTLSPIRHDKTIVRCSEFRYRARLRARYIIVLSDRFLYPSIEDARLQACVYRIRFPVGRHMENAAQFSLLNTSSANGTHNDTAFYYDALLCHRSGKRAEPSIKIVRNHCMQHFTASWHMTRRFSTPSS